MKKSAPVPPLPQAGQGPPSGNPGQPIVLGPINVDALVRKLAAERREPGPDRAEFRIEGPLPSMPGHEATFRQSLANLLDNA